MYVDMNRPAQTLSDIEARNRASQASAHQQSRIQQSAGSSQPLNLADHLDADANSSTLSQSPAPSHPPPSHSGPTPCVPSPPVPSANTQHRRNARDRRGKGQGGKGDENQDPLQTNDPWSRESWSRSGRNWQQGTWDDQGWGEDAWDQYRTPVNSNAHTALHAEPHPDHNHARTARTFETPTFSPFKPLNTNERAEWAGTNHPNVPTFPGTQTSHSMQVDSNPFAQTFASQPMFQSSQQPQQPLGSCQESSNPQNPCYHPTPAAHPYGS